MPKIIKIRYFLTEFSKNKKWTFFLGHCVCTAAVVHIEQF